MSVKLPLAVQHYFEGKNARDPALALSGFSPDALVGDESKFHQGHDEIASWMAETSAQYNETSEPLETRQEGDRLIVVAKVSGNFPGSPANLSYRFTFADEKIVRLEIGS